jgi:hypothetical protein
MGIIEPSTRSFTYAENAKTLAPHEGHKRAPELQ